MKKLSVKYSLNSDGFETHFIKYADGKIELSPYNYTHKYIFDEKISKTKLQNFVLHLNKILKV